MIKYNKYFDLELDSFILKNPNFKILKSDKFRYLKGIIDVESLGSFMVKILPTEDYPMRFPAVFEVGNDIPNKSDFHKYNNGSCCFTVYPNEILICKLNSLNLCYFKYKILLPYFANQIYKKKYGTYVDEYSHGDKGFKEFFDELYKTKNITLQKQISHYAFSNHKSQPNEVCYCGSGIKYKKCHFLIEEKIRKIGKKIIYRYIK